jgi:hypothetical protein
MSTQHGKTNNAGSVQRLEKIVDDIEPILDQQTFLTRELPGEKTHRKATVARLKVCGAVESLEVFRPDADTRGSYINKWKWIRHREHLQQYLADRNELPCGCRSHVPPETDDQGQYLCKFCGTAHTEQQIREAL